MRKINLSDELSAKLENDLEGLRIYHAVCLLDGYKFEVFANDHDPPHFHIIHDGYNIRFDLKTGVPLPNQQRNRKIERAVRKRFPDLKNELKAKWDETRLGDERAKD